MACLQDLGIPVFSHFTRSASFSYGQHALDSCDYYSVTICPEVSRLEEMLPFSNYRGSSHRYSATTAQAAIIRAQCVFWKLFSQMKFSAFEWSVRIVWEVLFAIFPVDFFYTVKNQPTFRTWSLEWVSFWFQLTLLELDFDFILNLICKRQIEFQVG